ncbi:MAG: hypothetical protein D6677_01725 [Calditrichaeota bacterium]|nr:MAG: hypothetical protein D6677_01725 [Calditrichota bacterium]
MEAYIIILNNPFFDVTDSTGRYKIKNIPAGNYNLTAWYFNDSKLTKSVNVPKNGSINVNFYLK